MCQHEFIVTEWRAFGGKNKAHAFTCNKCLKDSGELESELDSKKDKRSSGESSASKTDSRASRKK